MCSQGGGVELGDESDGGCMVAGMQHNRGDCG